LDLSLVIALFAQSTSGQGVHRIPCNHTPAPSDLPSRRTESGLPGETRNSLIIDPLKATKGRRMSKKSRKKSPKLLRGSNARVKPSAKSKIKAGTRGRAAASKALRDATSGPSHKPASKMLRSADTARSKAGRNSSAAERKTPALVEGAKVGDMAPAFRLTRDGGDSVALSDYSGNKLVLFFYPKADSPGCTREAIDFTRLADAFADSGTAVLGVSADSVRRQETFRDKHKLKVALISDERHEMLRAYGAWGEKSMYGRSFEGILRTTVLIGTDGRIGRIWRHVKVDGHADEVLEAARAL
jgi:thioredoxin-dependent peroxiredoxin